MWTEPHWKPLKYYGIPKKIITIIQQSYEGMSCRVVHRDQLPDCFNVTTGLRQGYLLIPFMFVLVRLDFDDHHRGNKEWNLVDPLVTAGGLRLC